MSVYDVENEDEDCCTALWTINGQPAGSSKLFEHYFGQDSFGTKTIAVVITDSGGNTATASVIRTLASPSLR